MERRPHRPGETFMSPSGRVAEGSPQGSTGLRAVTPPTGTPMWLVTAGMPQLPGAGDREVATDTSRLPADGSPRWTGVKVDMGIAEGSAHRARPGRA